MPKSGIKIPSETVGSGPELKKGDHIRVKCDIQLSRGEFLAKDQEDSWVVGDREMIAGFRYGLEGMRVGGTRTFRAAPHLCYAEGGAAGIPQNAVLVFSIKSLEMDA